MGYSPWGHRGSDTTERPYTHTHTHTLHRRDQPSAVSVSVSAPSPHQASGWAKQRSPSTWPVGKWRPQGAVSGSQGESG